MIVFLPNKRIKLNDLEKKFDFLRFSIDRNKLKNTVRHKPVLKLYLLKFKFEITHSLHYHLREVSVNEIKL